MLVKQPTDSHDEAHSEWDFDVKNGHRVGPGTVKLMGWESVHPGLDVVGRG